MIFHDVEQGSDEWFALRAGIPTASEVSKLVTGTGKKSTQWQGYAATLAAEAYAGKPLERWEGNWATERGKELEAEASETYAFVHDVAIVRTGFVTNRDAGCSPDGLIGDDGIHEIKCPLPKGVVEVCAYWHRYKKPEPGYLPQAQGELLVLEREWVDLTFHHPEMPGLTIRIYRDEPYIRELVRQIAAVNELRDEYLAILRAMR
jgi:hypothetical protein